MKKSFLIISLILCIASSNIIAQESKFTEINTTFSGDDAWKDWNIRMSGEYGSMSTTFSGDDAWNNWDMDLPNIDGSISTTFSGDDAWKSWNFDFGESDGSMSTVFSGDDAWKDWRISDNMPSEDVALKMAAIFVCVFSGSILNK